MRHCHTLHSGISGALAMACEFADTMDANVLLPLVKREGGLLESCPIPFLLRRG